MSTLRTPLAGPEPTPVAPASAEPPSIALERETLREIIRLVAERARAEAEVERVRASNDETTDRDYQERTKALQDRFQGGKAVELSEDTTRRRDITDASIAAENQAKDEFAKASRKLATEFDVAREQARGDHAKNRARATADFDAAEKQAAIQHSGARKPVDDATRLIEARKERLAGLYEDYKHFGPARPPTNPTPTRGGAQDREPARQGLRPASEA